jgi:hypothetical protein
MTPAETIARGQRAQRELELTEGVLDKMRAKALEVIAAADVSDMDAIKPHILQVRVIDALRKELGHIVRGGELEEIYSSNSRG